MIPNLVITIANNKKKTLFTKLWSYMDILWHIFNISSIIKLNFKIEIVLVIHKVFALIHLS